MDNMIKDSPSLKFIKKLLKHERTNNCIMNQHLKKIVLILFCLVIFSVVYVQVNAYVLQGPHILELMTQKLGKSERLMVSQKLILYDTSQEKGAVELEETLRYAFPEEFRSEILSKNVERIQVVSKGVILTVIDGKVVAEPETRFDRYKDLLLYRSRMLLEQRLSILGVDVKVSSLGRFEGKPAYVLGAQYPDESVQQIWFDKDSFRPFRWIIMSRTDESTDSSLEVRYLNWGQSDNTWYPMRIEFYKNDILLREINVLNIKMNPSFSKDLFDIEYLKSNYQTAAPIVPKQSEYKELDEVQKTIEEFKKIYE